VRFVPAGPVKFRGAPLTAIIVAPFSARALVKSNRERERTAGHMITARLVPPARRIRKEQSMIKKVKEGYKVISEKSGKNLGGPLKTKEQAKDRLRQVEFFKRKKR
jgi:hypothetical protein